MLKRGKKYMIQHIIITRYRIMTDKYVDLTRCD